MWIRREMKSERAFKRICGGTGTILIVLVLLCYLPAVLPSLFGWQGYAIVSGSMEPTLPVGSAVFARQTEPATLVPGDIVVYSSGEDSLPVTHRVVENRPDSRTLITKGDANETNDPLPVAYTQVLGRARFSVPLLGRLLRLVTTPRGKVGAAAVLALAVLLLLLPHRPRAEREDRVSGGTVNPKEFGLTGCRNCSPLAGQPQFMAKNIHAQGFHEYLCGNSGMDVLDDTECLGGRFSMTQVPRQDLCQQEPVPLTRTMEPPPLTRRKSVAWLCVPALLVLGLAVWKLGPVLWGYRDGDTSYSELAESVRSLPVASEREAISENSGQQSSYDDSGIVFSPADPSYDYSDIIFPTVDFEALRAINPDIVGWLYCEGTVIDYPVVQGEDNEWYLDHLFDGQQNSNGCIFLDSRNRADMSSAHSILYGHHMKSGSMFATLMNYKDPAYYEAHPRLLYLTPEQNYVIELFAGTVYSSQSDTEAWQLIFETVEELQTWLMARQAESTFAAELSPTAYDRIVSLSTCSYEFDDARYVLTGVLRPWPAG